MYSRSKLSTELSASGTSAPAVLKHLSNQALRIRSAYPEDWPSLADIYNEAIRTGCSTMDVALVGQEYFQKLVSGFTSRETMLVAEHPSQVVAWGIVKQYSDRPGYAYACESSVYVHTNNQGQRIGSNLQTAVLSKARELGYRHLVAKILAINETSIRFHRAFGYDIVGKQQKIGFLNGTWQDVVIMQCILNDPQPKGAQ